MNEAKEIYFSLQNVNKIKIAHIFYNEGLIKMESDKSEEAIVSCQEALGIENKNLNFRSES